MIQPSILKKHGTTNERLRAIFTCVRPANFAELSADEQQRIERDLKTRKTWEDRINNQSQDQLSYNLQHSHAFAAVDLAYDSPPIAKEMVPLMLWAQDKLDTKKCISAMTGLENYQQYITKNKKTNQEEINLPKFVETHINLVQSLVDRRLSAQTTKYNSFYPYHKYDPRSTNQVAKLRGDVMSQVAESSVDQFDIRGHNEQVWRDTLLYGQVVDFVKEDWIRLHQLRESDQGGEEQCVVKEGLDFACPHPSHLIWDRSKPLSAIRKDYDLPYIGYWDMVVYGDVCDNPDFFNRDEITYNDSFLQIFTTYSSYWSQYYCTINTGSLADRLVTSMDANSRPVAMGKYASETKDAPVLLTVYFAKLTPIDWGMGTYPYPVWVRFVAAGCGTIVSAKIMPSSPAGYCGIGQRDSRMWSASFAMKVITFQDMLSNLMTQLMAEMKARRLKIVGIDTDGMDQKEIDLLDSIILSENYYEHPIVIKYSGAKKTEEGLLKSVTDPVTVKQPNNNPGDITAIVTSMIQVVSLAERINLMSSNEVGQPIVRGNGGVTATEAGNIESTTNVTSAAVSDSFDAHIADQKRIYYESHQAMGSPNIQVPVFNRYPPSIIQKAGFQVYDEDGDGQVDLLVPARRTLLGTKEKLVYSYVFNTRDGSKRVVNAQTATTLIQLIPILQNEMIMQAVGKSKFWEILNEIFRQSGSGIDLNLEVAPGDEEFNLPADRAADQLADIVGQLQQVTEKTVQDVAKLQQQLPQQVAQIVQQVLKQLMQPNQTR